MNIITKTWKHFCLVNKHRWLVFQLSIKAGIPWRGLVHDLSKYSPTEFWESVKYYTGERSPIIMARKEIGYSKAWLHHKGRNKHHFEYWEDLSKTERFPVFIPYPYLVEGVCDKIAAGMAYKGKAWTKEEPLKYWTEIEKPSPVLKHPACVFFMDTVLTKIKEEGLDAGLNSKYLKELYRSIEEREKL